MRAIVFAVALAACSTPGPIGPADAAPGDVTGDAASDAPADGEPGDGPGPTPMEWAACSEFLPRTYGVRACTDLPAAGLEGTAQPRWFCETGAREAPRLQTVEACIREQIAAQMMSDRTPFLGSWIAACPIADLPPPCQCNCAGHAFRATSCPGYADGRHYLGQQLGQAVRLAGATGRCWRR